MNRSTARTSRRIRIATILPALLFAAVAAVERANAGGGPQDVLVVVNDQDLESLEAGSHYAAARGIAPRQILHIDIPAWGHIKTNNFETLVRQPIDAYLAASGLDAQVDYFVFAFDRPIRVTADGANVNGITAAAYYGYKDAPPAPPCNLTAGAANEYFDREIFFTHDASFLPGDRRIALTLAADSLEDLKTFIDRSAAADGTRPTGTVYLVHTTDTARNVQWPQFEDTAFRDGSSTTASTGRSPTWAPLRGRPTL